LRARIFSLPAVIRDDFPSLPQRIALYIIDSTFNTADKMTRTGRSRFARGNARGNDKKRSKRRMFPTRKVDPLLSAEELPQMRVAGQLAASVLEMIDPHVAPGVSTEALDALCHEYIVNEIGCTPAPLGYRSSPQQTPYPKSICTSVNHVICHGIPSEKKLKSGDIINIDVTVIKDGYHGDTSKMFLVGKPSPHAERLVKVTQECLYLGIGAVRPGAHLGDIGHAIQCHAERNRYSVVRDFCGHGIGRVFHGEPQVLHYGKPGEGVELVEGMTFTIEPMINLGAPSARLLPDGWTAVTKDRKLSAQWEHTILVTTDGAEVLTLRGEEDAPPASP